MRRRSIVAAGLAGALLLGTAGVAGATADATANRLQGPDRYTTSANVAKATFTANPTVALIANGASPADAIAASYVSGVSQAPVLLSEQGSVPASVMAALSEMDVKGVILVGGTSVLGTKVEEQLSQAGYTVERINGANRFDTAKKLTELFPKETVGTFMGGPAAFVARGDNFADALAAGPLSAAQGLPILMSDAGALNSETKAALTNLAIEQVLLLGGPGAISQAVEDEIVGMGIAVRRVFGQTRQDTAVELAKIAVGELQFPLTRVLLARGDASHFADALAGASRGGQVFAPLLLTTGVQTVGSATRAYLAANSATITTVDVLGGTSAISQGAADAAVASARGQS